MNTVAVQEKKVNADEKGEEKKVKCVVWDLDNTIWDGVLLEDENVVLRDGVVDIIKELDQRGMLQSIASKNEYDLAMGKLKEMGLDEYFLYPQINWNSKSISIKTIAQSINIGIDSLAFIDDQSFELEEVAFTHKDVLCLRAQELEKILNLPQMNPKFITEDSKIRRLMYQSDIERKKIEENYEGPQEEFLSTLNMVFTISPVGDGDLQRAEELTVRTHQLNTTGYTYSYEDLDAFRKSEKHKLLISSLDDKYGTYGKIGLCLVECESEFWVLKLLLMSCRVMSRGVGTVMLNHIMSLAKKEGKRLRAEFVSNDRNRMMYVTFKFAGFKEIDQVGDMVILENDLEHVQAFPEYLEVKIIE
ncbi:MAG: HAD-IIIC family phosphatase [Clostridiaceae bacterium]|nr:HAD-IIIC family phosphatase [Clostridiaceae bacterium]